jgi:hypothetical protein
MVILREVGVAIILGAVGVEQRCLVGLRGRDREG